MSTLTVSNIQLNQEGNAAISIANSYNVVISVDGTEKAKFASDGIIINGNLTASGAVVNNAVINSGDITSLNVETLQVDSNANFANIIKYNGQTVAFNENLFINPGFTVKKRVSAASGQVAGSNNTDAIYAELWFDLDNITNNPDPRRQIIGNTTNLVYYAANCDVTSATTTFSATNYYVAFRSFVEGHDLYNKLGWGKGNTAEVSPATVSFWIRSNQATKYSLVLRYKQVTGSATIAYYGTTFDINQRNTWEFKKIVIPPPTNITASNAQIGICHVHIAGVGGSSRVVNASETDAWQYNSNVKYAHINANNYLSNTQTFIQLAAPQFEKGNVANPVFTYKSYTEELNRVERYIEYFYGAPDNGSGNTPIFPSLGMAITASTMRFAVPLKKGKPYIPSIYYDTFNGFLGNSSVRLQYAGATYKDLNAIPSIVATYPGAEYETVAVDVSINTGLTVGSVGYLIANTQVDQQFPYPWYSISAIPTP